MEPTSVHELLFYRSTLFNFSDYQKFDKKVLGDNPIPIHPSLFVVKRDIGGRS